MPVAAAAATTTTTPATTSASPAAPVAPEAPAARHRGLFTIPVTPFTDNGALDVDSLRRVVAFCLETGANGVVSPVNVSEFTTLSPAERETVFRTIAREIASAGAAGRVPFVAGVGAPTIEEALTYARRARDAGADAVIAMPTYATPLDEQGCFDFYAALAQAVDLPIYVQNHEPVGAWTASDGGAPCPGRAMSAELLARILREIDGVRYVKEESAGTGAKMVRTVELAGAACDGVMGGKASRFLVDEYRRGACGTMPACEVNDAHAQLWRALDGGHEAAARLILRTMLPLLDFEEALGVAVCKEVLYRRRLIASPFQRLPGPALDRYDHAELDRLLAEVAPLFTVKTPITRPV
jgi:4-hydroxy-tetrahydrodipicolinate synthase